MFTYQTTDRQFLVDSPLVEYKGPCKLKRPKYLPIERFVMLVIVRDASPTPATYEPIRASSVVYLAAGVKRDHAADTAEGACNWLDFAP